MYEKQMQGREEFCATITSNQLWSKDFTFALA